MSLREYRSDAWNRSAPSTGENGFTPSGPLVSPIKSAPCGPISPTEALKRVDCISKDTTDLAVLMSMLVDMLTPNNPPKGAIPVRQFNQESITAVAQGASASLITEFNVIEGYAGYIQRVQCRVDPEPAAVDVEFMLAINNKVVPNFDRYTNAVDTAFELNVRIPPTSTIQIYAKNIGTGSVIVGATLIGWIAPIRRY